MVTKTASSAYITPLHHKYTQRSTCHHQGNAEDGLQTWHVSVGLRLLKYAPPPELPPSVNGTIGH